MAIDPEIRQAIDELRVLVQEALKASGAIDRAASSGSRTGERTSTDPGMARHGVQSGRPAGAIPGYLAVGGIAAGYGFNRQRASLIEDQLRAEVASTPAIYPSLLPSSARGLAVPGASIPAASAASMLGRTGMTVTGADPRGPLGGGPGGWFGPSTSAIPPLGSAPAGILRVGAIPHTASGAIRTSAANPALLSGMHSRAGRAADWVVSNSTKILTTAAVLAQGINSWNEAVGAANAQELATTKDIDELKRQRVLDPVLEANLRDLNKMTAQVKRDDAFRAETGSAINSAAMLWIAGKTFGGGLAAGAKAVPSVIVAYIAVQGLLRGYDVLSGADARRVEAKKQAVKSAFKQDFEYELSKDTTQRMLMRFTEQNVQDRGWFHHGWVKSKNLFGLIGDSEEQFQDEGMVLLQAEYKRQSPKIAEARASLRFGDVYMAQRKFDQAADALHLKNDVPFMWRNPQGWFATHESSRIASRNWASSQMSRAKIRTGN